MQLGGSVVNKISKLQATISKKHGLFLAMGMLLPFSQAAFAQALDIGVDLNDSREFRGYAQLGASYTDNFYYSPNPGRGVAGLQFKSDLSYVYALPRFRFAALGGMQAEGFNIANSADAYVDGHVNLAADWRAAERHGFSYLVNSVFGHDPFGTERTAGGVFNNAELDHWRALGMGGKYAYGLSSDPINLEVRLNGNTKQYTTNTAVTQFIDYSALTGGATVLFNYSPKTAFLLDVSGNQTNFDKAPLVPNQVLDYTEYRVLTGVRWLATAKTSGDVRVGYFNHQPKAGSVFEQVSSVDWQVNAKWEPLSTRSFTMTAGRSSIPSYLTAVSFIDNQAVSITWREDWTERFTTKLMPSYTIQDFHQSVRRDNLFSTNFVTEYKLAQSVALVNYLTYSFRHSNTAAVEFDRLAAFAGVRVLF